MIELKNRCYLTNFDLYNISLFTYCHYSFGKMTQNKDKVLITTGAYCFQRRRRSTFRFCFSLRRWRIYVGMEEVERWKEGREETKISQNVWPNKRMV